MKRERARAEREALARKRRAAVEPERAAVARAKARAKGARAAARSACKREAVELRPRVRKLRELRREETRAIVGAMRAELRGACELRKDRAATLGATVIAKRKAALKRAITEARKHYRKTKPRARTTARERRSESDDEVRRNIPAALVPIFDAMRRQIKRARSHTRAEAPLRSSLERTAPRRRT